jgi:hypothetical protein
MAIRQKSEAAQASVSPSKHLPSGGQADPHRYRTLAQRGLAALITGFFLLGACGPSADATESTTPFLPGVTIATPVGTLPPPGLYFLPPNGRVRSLSEECARAEHRRSRGGAVDEPATDLGSRNAQDFWRNLWRVHRATRRRADYERFRTRHAHECRNGEHSHFTSQSRMDPGRWDFLNFGITTYGPAFSYRVGWVENTSRNYATIEPGIGLSYLSGG